MTQEALPNLFVGWVGITEPSEDRVGEWQGQFVTMPAQWDQWSDEPMSNPASINVNVIDFAHDRTVYGSVILTKMVTIKGIIGCRLFDFRGMGAPVIFDGEMLP